MIENVKRYRPHTSHGHDVAKTLCILYVAVAVLQLVPYLKYAAWLLPLVFLLLEKESDFALYMEAQLTALSLIAAALAFLFNVPLAALLRTMNTSLSFGWVLAGDFGSLLASILAAFVSVAAIVLMLIAASRALSYIQTRILFAGAIAEKILTLDYFKD